MQARDVIRTTLQTSTMVLKAYLDDLSDEDLMRRPAAGCNHLAWQLGHLIASEHAMLEAMRPGAAAALPEGFAEQHNNDTAGEDDPGKFRSKAEYLQLYDQMQSSTLASLEKETDKSLDEPSPEHFRNMFPTVGAIYSLIATHPLMHAGQFVPVRRQLGKPIVM